MLVGLGVVPGCRVLVGLAAGVELAVTVGLAGLVEVRVAVAVGLGGVTEPVGLTKTGVLVAISTSRMAVGVNSIFERIKLTNGSTVGRGVTVRRTWFIEVGTING